MFTLMLTSALALTGPKPLPLPQAAPQLTIPEKTGPRLVVIPVKK